VGYILDDEAVTFVEMDLEMTTFPAVPTGISDARTGTGFFL